MPNIVTVVAVNTQFSIAVHVMASLGHRLGQHTTSAQLAMSVNTSPSFVRRVLAKLSKAGLVETTKGQAGACWLSMKPKDVSLLDIYSAVGAPKAFAIHDYDVERRCPVSCHIKFALEKVLVSTQQAMEAGLGKIKLSDVLCDLTPK